MAGRLTADDRLEIMDLLARYCHAMDDGDAVAFLSCFIADAFMDIGYRTVSGAAEMRDFADYYAKKPGRPGWRHTISTSALDGDAERCRVRSYMVLFTKGADGKTEHGGHVDYIDDCVKVDGRWLMAKHTVRS